MDSRSTVHLTSSSASSPFLTPPSLPFPPQLRHQHRPRLGERGDALQRPLRLPRRHQHHRLQLAVRGQLGRRAPRGELPLCARRGMQGGTPAGKSSARFGFHEASRVLCVCLNSRVKGARGHICSGFLPDVTVISLSRGQVGQSGGILLVSSRLRPQRPKAS